MSNPTKETLSDIELEKDIQKKAPRVIKNMNKDHSDSIRAYAMAFGENKRCAKETKAAKIVAIDRHGLLLDVTLTDGTILSDIRVFYQGKVMSSKDLRREALNMHIAAYAKLGFWFRIRNGYYQQLAKVFGIKVYRKIMNHPIQISVAITASVVLFSMGYIACRLPNPTL